MRMRTIAVAALVSGAVITPNLASAQGAPLRLAIVHDAQQGRPEIRLTTPSSGYLLLLAATDRGTVVLFPGKPNRTAQVLAGEYDFERLNASVPYWFGRGTATIVALWSETPIRTRDFVRYGHWAMSDLPRREFAADPVAASIALARRLGASPQLLAVSVEYDRPHARGIEARSLAATGDQFDGRSIRNRQYANYNNILTGCPSGTRDVTGAGEFCSSPERSRRAPRQTTSQEEPPPPPPHPPQVHTPAPAYQGAGSTYSQPAVQPPAPAPTVRTAKPL